MEFLKSLTLDVSSSCRGNLQHKWFMTEVGSHWPHERWVILTDKQLYQPNYKHILVIMCNNVFHTNKQKQCRAVFVLQGARPQDSMNSTGPD